MKNLMNLKGVKALSKMQLKRINGGDRIYCRTDRDCPPDSQCVQRWCT